MRQQIINASLKALVFGSFLCVSNSQASSLTFDLNTNYGSGTPGGDVLVTITEAATAGAVHIDITNLTLGFLNEIYFNYATPADIASGVISNFVATNGVVGVPTVKYNGVQGFAISFDFPNQSGPNFTTGEAVSFDLSAADNLTVGDFNVLGQGPTGDNYYVSAHINGTSGNPKIGDVDGGNVSGNDLGSEEIEAIVPTSIPEPATGLLIGLGLLGIALLSRKRLMAQKSL